MSWCQPLCELRLWGCGFGVWAVRVVVVGAFEAAGVCVVPKQRVVRDETADVCGCLAASRVRGMRATSTTAVALTCCVVVSGSWRACAEGSLEAGGSSRKSQCRGLRHGACVLARWHGCVCVASVVRMGVPSGSRGVSHHASTVLARWDLHRARIFWFCRRLLALAVTTRVCACGPGGRGSCCCSSPTTSSRCCSCVWMCSRRQSCTPSAPIVRCTPST